MTPQTALNQTSSMNPVNPTNSKGVIHYKLELIETVTIQKVNGVDKLVIKDKQGKETSFDLDAVKLSADNKKVIIVDEDAGDQELEVAIQDSSANNQDGAAESVASSVGFTPEMQTGAIVLGAAAVVGVAALALKKKKNNNPQAKIDEGKILDELKKGETAEIKKIFEGKDANLKEQLAKFLLDTAAKSDTSPEMIKTIMGYVLENQPRFSSKITKELASNTAAVKRIEDTIKDNKELSDKFKTFIGFGAKADEIIKAENPDAFKTKYKDLSQEEKDILVTKYFSDKTFLTSVEAKKMAENFGKTATVDEAKAQLVLLAAKEPAVLALVDKERAEFLLTQPPFEEALATASPEVVAKVTPVTGVQADAQAAPPAAESANAEKNKFTVADREKLMAGGVITVDKLADIILTYAVKEDSKADEGNYGSTNNEKLLQNKLADLAVKKYSASPDKEKIGLLKLISALNAKDLTDTQKAAVVKFLTDNKTAIEGLTGLDKEVKAKLDADKWKEGKKSEDKTDDKGDKDKTADLTGKSAQEIAKAFTDGKLKADSTVVMDAPKQTEVINLLVAALSNEKVESQQKANIVSNVATFFNQFSADNQKSIADKFLISGNAASLAQLNNVELATLFKASSLDTHKKLELVAELLKNNGNLVAKKILGNELSAEDQAKLFAELVKTPDVKTIGNAFKAIFSNGLDTDRTDQIKGLVNNPILKVAINEAIASDKDLQVKIFNNQNPVISKDDLVTALANVALEGKEVKTNADGDIFNAIKKAFTKAAQAKANELAEKADANTKTANADAKAKATETIKAGLDKLLNGLAKNKALFEAGTNEANKKALLDSLKNEALAKVFVELPKETKQALIDSKLFSVAEVTEIFNASGVEATEQNAPEAVVKEFKTDGNQVKLFYMAVKDSTVLNDINDFFKYLYNNVDADIKTNPNKPAFKYKPANHTEKFKAVLLEKLKTKEGAEAYGSLSAVDKASYVIGAGGPAPGKLKFISQADAIETIALFIAGGENRESDGAVRIDGIDLGTGVANPNEAILRIRPAIVKLMSEGQLSSDQIKNILINYGAAGSILHENNENGNLIRDHFRTQFKIAANDSTTGNTADTVDNFGRNINSVYSKAVAGLTATQVNGIFAVSAVDGANDINNNKAISFRTGTKDARTGDNGKDTNNLNFIAKIVFGAMLNDDKVDFAATTNIFTVPNLQAKIIGAATSMVNVLVHTKGANGLSSAEASNLLKNLGKTGAASLWTDPDGTNNPHALSAIIANSNTENLAPSTKNVYYNENLFKAFVTADLNTLKGLVFGESTSPATGQYKLTHGQVTVLFKAAFEEGNIKLDSSLAAELSDVGTAFENTLKTAFINLFSHGVTGVFGNNVASANADYWSGNTFANIYKAIANNAEVLAAMKLTSLTANAENDNFKATLLSTNLIQKFLDLESLLQYKIINSKLFAADEVATAIVTRSKLKNYDNGDGTGADHAQVDLKKANKDVLQKVKEEWIKGTTPGASGLNSSLLKNIDKNKLLLKGNDEHSQKLQNNIKLIADNEELANGDLEEKAKHAAAKSILKDFTFIDDKATATASDESAQGKSGAVFFTESAISGNGHDNKILYASSNKSIDNHNMDPHYISLQNEDNGLSNLF